MRIAMIAAMTDERVIGLDNDMPWHLPDDLRHFKAKTTGKPVIMGRKTFESIGSRPLPNRPNIVISRNAELQLDGVAVFSSVDEALQSLGDVEEAIIMGGGQLYAQMLPRADRLYLTLIHAQIDGDTHFPDWRALSWQEIERESHAVDERHAYAFDFVTLDRC
ncbi:type 3 dihydrofolate reductase [Thiomicrorhabdus heinhorstiae]|uniref:Dihydrofolate reductase n=1 Tax=Thiomicrorhabdus heinhorstiae TaxID=2748010 RepID=A0ABS0BYR7_9GAMM|nr:type 3 dihydrofolate reductase [Thiomicrorhabdus heinhorstiae]MBF6058569.1 type 3 dihydrofolate reductase [Thiomicrorhabdus heinhorstiae]